MRACFLAQNVCALGFGVAMIQTFPIGEFGPWQDMSAAESMDRIACFPAPPLENLMSRELRRRPTSMDSLSYLVGVEAPGYPAGVDAPGCSGEFRPWA